MSLFGSYSGRSASCLRNRGKQQSPPNSVSSRTQPFQWQAGRLAPTPRYSAPAPKQASGKPSKGRVWLRLARPVPAQKPRSLSSSSKPSQPRPLSKPGSRPQRVIRTHGTVSPAHRTAAPGRQQTHKATRGAPAPCRRLFALPKFDAKQDGKVIRAPRGTLGYHNTAVSNFQSITRSGLKLSKFRSTHNTKGIYFRAADYGSVTATRFSGNLTFTCDLSGLKMIPRFTGGKVYELVVLEDVHPRRILHGVNIGNYP